MTPTELYTLTIEDYKRVLSFKDMTLRDFCKQKHVYYNGIQAWMYRHSIHVAELRKKYLRTDPKPAESPKEDLPTGHSIFPLTFHSSPGLAEKTEPCIKGVNITFPDGVIVTIKEITREDLSLFIQTHLTL